MSCVIRITSSDLRRLVERETFDTFQALKESLIGPEFLVNGRAGVLLSMRVIGGAVVFTSSVDGVTNTNTPISVVARMPSEAALPEVAEEAPTDAGVLEDLTATEAEANAEPFTPIEVMAQPQPEAPAEAEDQTPATRPTLKSVSPKFNPDESKVAWKGFEATTGQDVLDEENGVLNSDPVAIDRIKAKNELFLHGSRYEVFIVDATDDFRGHEGLGEGLVIVEKGSVGKFPTSKELAAATMYPLLPLQGLSPTDTSGAEDTFFSRNHEERLTIAEQKLGLTRKQAEKFYRDGQAKMKAARRKAKKGPVRVGIKSVSPGSRRLTERRTVALGPNAIVRKTLVGGTARVFAEVSPTFERFHVEVVKILDVVPKGILEAMVVSILEGKPRLDTEQFFAALFPSQKKQGTLNYDPLKKKLFFGPQPITSVSMFFDALDLAPFPKIHDKLKAEGQQNQYPIVTEDRSYVGSTQDFLREFTAYAEKWTFEDGTATDLNANVVVYLDLDVKAEVSAATLPRASTISKLIGIVAMGLDAKKYAMLLESQEEEAIKAKAMYPGLFSDAFRRTILYKRILGGVEVRISEPMPAILAGQAYFKNPKEYEDYIGGLSKSDQSAIKAAYDSYRKATVTPKMTKEERNAAMVAAMNKAVGMYESGILLGEEVFGHQMTGFWPLGDMSMKKTTAEEEPRIGRLHALNIMVGTGKIDQESAVAMTEGRIDWPERLVIYSDGQTRDVSVVKEEPELLGFDIDNAMSIVIVEQDQTDKFVKIVENLDSSAREPITGPLKGAARVVGAKLAAALAKKFPYDVFSVDELEKIRAKAAEGKFKAKLPIGLDSGEAIKDGRKTITLRQPRMGDQSGLFDVDGAFFEAEFMGELTFSQVGEQFGMTLDSIISNLTGDPNATIENIKEESVLSWMNGTDTKAVYRFHRLDETANEIQETTISCKL